MNRNLNQIGTATKALGLLLVLLACGVSLTSPAEVLVPKGSVWRYLDDGSNQGTAWFGTNFSDSAWHSGPAELGYGDDADSRPEQTVVGYGPVSTNKYVTTYFRRTFTVTNAVHYTNLTVNLLRDDGAVVYLNGAEAFRQNMPAGAITYSALASTNVTGNGEAIYYATNINPNRLISGTNVLAVEIHQFARSSTDISFDLELTDAAPPVTPPPAPAPATPPSIAINSPVNGALVSLPTTLNVSVSDPSNQLLTVTFFGRVAGPPAGQDFTVIALPDTQYYAGSVNSGTPAMFTTQTDWILTNRLSRNIAFVTQLGDCVEDGDKGGSNLVQWANATNALYRLESPALTGLANGIPYGVAVGNHDQSPNGDPDGTTTFYNQFFGAGHFGGRPYYGGHYGTNNDNHFEFFSASGLDFIILHLEYDMQVKHPEVLAWANNVIQTNQNRRAIVVSHGMLDTGTYDPISNTNAGRWTAQGPQGAAIYNALRTNSNVFLMLCGHVPGEGRRMDTFNGHSIHTVLSDYQGRTNGGDGWMRILTFSPSNNVIHVRTCSPVVNQFETDPDSQFDLPYYMQNGGGAYTAIATLNGVHSGTSVTADWSGLLPSTDYEWFAVVTDGVRTNQTMPVRLRTPAPAQAPVLPQVEVVVVNAMASEAGPVSGSFTVQRAGGTDSPLTVKLLIGGSASNGIDYEHLDDTVTIPVGASAVNVAVTPKADALVEGTETVEISLVGDSAYQINFSTTAIIGICDGQTDSDGDGSSDAAEILAGTNPVNAASKLRITSFRRVGTNMELTWTSVPGRTYRVCARASLNDPNWQDVSGNLRASSQTTSWSEAINAEAITKFYSVRVAGF
jgi:hypothetical protein